MALVSAIPGTSGISAPMVAAHRLTPIPPCTSSSAVNDAAPELMTVRKKTLDPSAERAKPKGTRPPARPANAAHTPSRAEPPKNREKKQEANHIAQRNTTAAGNCRAVGSSFSTRASASSAAGLPAQLTAQIIAPLQQFNICPMAGIRYIWVMGCPPAQ